MSLNPGLAPARTRQGALGLSDEEALALLERIIEANSDDGESELWGGDYERVQILTVTELLSGKKPEVPKFLAAYQKAAKIAAAVGEQQALWEASS